MAFPIDALVASMVERARIEAVQANPQPARTLEELQAARAPSPTEFDPTFFGATAPRLGAPTGIEPEEEAGFLNFLRGVPTAVGSAFGPVGAAVGAATDVVLPILGAFGVLPGPSDGPDPRLKGQRDINRQLAANAFARLGAENQVDAAGTLLEVLFDTGLVTEVGVSPKRLAKLRRTPEGVLGKGGVDVFNQLTGRTDVAEALIERATFDVPSQVTTAVAPSPRPARLPIPPDSPGQFAGKEDRTAMTVPTTPGSGFFGGLGSFLGETLPGIAQVISATRGGGGGRAAAPMMLAPTGAMGGGGFSFPGVPAIPGGASGTVPTTPSATPVLFDALMREGREMGAAIGVGDGACITRSPKGRFPHKVEFMTTTPAGTPKVETYVRYVRPSESLRVVKRSRRCKRGPR